VAIGVPYTVAAGNSGVKATSFTVSVTTTTQAGDALVASGAINAGTVTSVTDSKGNAWVLPPGASNVAVSPKVYVWVALNAAALVAGTDTITFHYSGAFSTGNDIIVRACSGVMSSGAVDVAINASGTSASPSSGSTGTLGQASEWPLAALSSGNSGGTPTAWTGGFTALASQQNGGTEYLTVADQIVASTAALTAGATITSAPWSIVVVTLKAAPASVTSARAPVPQPGSRRWRSLYRRPQMMMPAIPPLPPVPPPLFPGLPLSITVELLLNGTWTDISGFCQQRAPIVITRGRADEAQAASPATMSLTLSNRGGDFSPRNSAGQFYPFIGRNTQIRVSVTASSASGAVYSGYRFWGEVSSWPPRWDYSGEDVYVPVVAAGILRRFAQGASIGSALRRFYTLKNDATTPVSYWPCEEQAAATQFANVVSPGDDMVFTGTPGIASDSSFLGSDPIPLISKSTWTGNTGSFSSSGDDIFTTPGIHLWTAPFTGTVNAKTWGAGGGGAGSGGNGTAGGSSSIAGDAVTVLGHGGGPGTTTPAGGSRGTGSTNAVHFNGGAGATHGTNSTGCGNDGGGGGGSGGTGAVGLDSGGKPGAAAVTGGGPGGDGGDYRFACTPNNALAPASGPGGGGGGAGGHGGGGGGEFAQETALAVTAGVTYTVIVGAGGQGGTGTGSGGNGYAGKVEIISTPTGTPNAVVVRHLLDIPAAGAVTGATISRTLISSGTLSKIELYYGTGGKLGFRGFDTVPVIKFDSGVQSFSADGRQLMVSMELVVSGANINWKLTAIVPGAASVVASFTGSFAGTIGAASQVVVNPAGNIDDTGIGHVVVQYAVENLIVVSSSLNGHAGERAADRFARLCTEQGVASALTGNGSDTPLMGPQSNEGFVSLLQEIEDADRGQLIEPRDFFGLRYRTRVSMQNQAPGLALDYSARQLSGTLEPAIDDSLTRNDVTVGRVNGATVQIALESGALSNLPPPDGVGSYTFDLTANVATDDQLTQMAQWILSLGTVDEYRYPVITLNLASPGVAPLFASAPAADAGDFVQIANTPSWLPAGPVKQLALGFTESLGAYEWVIDMNLVPESPYEGAGLPAW
jgi:hypothetical protein